MLAFSDDEEAALPSNSTSSFSVLEGRIAGDMLSPEEQRLFDRDPEKFLRENDDIARAFKDLAVEKILGLPHVQELLTTQFRVMLADPGSLRQAKQAGAEEKSTGDDEFRRFADEEEEDVKQKGKCKDQGNSDSDQVEQILEGMRRRQEADQVSREADQSNRLPRRTREAEVETMEAADSRWKTGYAGVPCPVFCRRSAPVPLTGGSTVFLGRQIGKDTVKIAEFSGNKGYASPDDAETWLRSVARAVKINKWSAEEAFEHVQSKLIVATTTWFQNREHLFNDHPRGPESGCREFWEAFKQRYIAQDEQTLWNQFESRTQQPDER